MKNYQNFDFKLSEISQLLSNIPNDFKYLLDEKEFNKFRTIVARSLGEILMYQNNLYEKYPDLMHDYLKEDKQNCERMNMLAEIDNQAHEFFNDKKFKEAKEKFEELLQKAEFGHYKLVAEVMLYECKHRLKSDFDEMKIKSYQTYENLDEIYQKALKFEKEKEFAKAIEIYENLLKTSKFSEFENKAMAGLYRCEKALNLY